MKVYKIYNLDMGGGPVVFKSPKAAAEFLEGDLEYGEDGAFKVEICDMDEAAVNALPEFGGW